MGFDYVPLSDVLDPAISVVAQDTQAIGRSAAELLFRRLDGDASPTVHHVVPVKLIARGSGEIKTPRDRGGRRGSRRPRRRQRGGHRGARRWALQHGDRARSPWNPGRVSRHALARRLREPARGTADRGRRRHVTRPLVRCSHAARSGPSARRRREHIHLQFDRNVAHRLATGRRARAARAPCGRFTWGRWAWQSIRPPPPTRLSSIAKQGGGRSSSIRTSGRPSSATRAPIALGSNDLRSWSTSSS